jgi:transcription antitermination factor NusG
VADLLTKKKIENYCPVNRIYRQWSDRKKIVLEPLFTSYVFVNIDETEQLQVRMTDGVINFVYWLSKPAVIRNEEIDIIKRFLNEFKNVKVLKVPLSVLDTVRITSGPFMEQQGQVVALKNKTVKVALPSLGYVMSAEIERASVELVQSSIHWDIKVLENLVLK